MRMTFMFAAPLAIMAGCAAQGLEDESMQTTEALRALESNEIVGNLAYGQNSSPVAYTEQPRYRAFRFTAGAKDRIDAWVRSSNGGDARAWLLDSTFATLTTNDNATPQTKDSRIEATLAQAGTYYIAFRDSNLEDTTFTVSLSGTPPTCELEDNCNPDGGGGGGGGDGGTGRVVVGQDRTFNLTDNMSDAVIETWGKGLWEGYVSFDVQLTGEPSHDRGRLIDASGTSFPVNGEKIRHERLPLPVTLKATTDTSVLSRINLTAVRYEVTRVNPIPQQSITGKFNGANRTAIRVIGSDIPGVSMNFTAQGRFFQNFTNGNGCGRLVINGSEITPSNASRSLSLVAPLNIESWATCVSSPLSNPENPNADYELGLSNISVGDPR